MYYGIYFIIYFIVYCKWLFNGNNEVIDIDKVVIV